MSDLPMTTLSVADLYTTHRDWAVRVVMNWTNQYHQDFLGTAEDIVQEAFLRMFLKYPEVEPRGVRTFIRRVLEWTWKDHWKSINAEKRRGGAVSLDGLVSVAEAKEADGEGEGYLPIPHAVDDTATQATIRVDLGRALSGLSSCYRRAILDDLFLVDRRGRERSLAARARVLLAKELEAA